MASKGSGGRETLPAGEGGVLWTAPAGVRRGPKPRFTLAGIREAAMVIADADGLEAVTMQRVAAQLGTTKMALYRYVNGRADLESVMLDRALGDPPSVDGLDWQAVLREWALTLHSRAHRHPWAVELAQRPHIPGPSELGWYEAGLAAITGLPLRAGERLDLLALLTGHVLALVRQETGSSTPEEDLAAHLGVILTQHAAHYPCTAAAVDDAEREGARNEALGFGVDRILAGTAALVAERSGRA